MSNELLSFYAVVFTTKQDSLISADTCWLTPDRTQWDMGFTTDVIRDGASSTVHPPCTCTKFTAVRNKHDDLLNCSMCCPHPGQLLNLASSAIYDFNVFRTKLHILCLCAQQCVFYLWNSICAMTRFRLRSNTSVLNRQTRIYYAVKSQQLQCKLFSGHTHSEKSIPKPHTENSDRVLHTQWTRQEHKGERNYWLPN